MLAMRARLLHHFEWLRRAALLATPLGALALAACCPRSNVDEIFLIRDPAPPALQPLIDACRNQAQPDCIPLCREVSGQRYVTFQHCELHPDGAGYIQVHVGYRSELSCE